MVGLYYGKRGREEGREREVKGFVHRVVRMEMKMEDWALRTQRRSSVTCVVYF